MFARTSRSAVRRASTSAAIVLLLACHAWAAESEQNIPAKETPVANLVQKALENELAGDNQQRQALLQDALHQSPDNEAAHWQSGDVRLQGAWHSTAEAERLARQNQRLGEYLRRREVTGPTAEAQAALARWCHKNHLDDQERSHWQAVLKIQPDNAEAVQGLGLRPYGGMLLTQAEIDQIKAQVRDVQKAMERWQPLVTQRRLAAERHESGETVAALEKVRNVSDRAEMLGLEKDLWRQVGAKRRLYQEMTLALIKALNDNRSPAAAESLARYAVSFDSKDIRAAAIEGLKRHPLDHYVPLLLSGLQSPIEANMQCSLDAAGNLVANYSLFQEGALANLSTAMTLSPAYAAKDLAPMAPVSATPGTGTVVFFGSNTKERLLRTDPGGVAAIYSQARAKAAAIPTLAANANVANRVAAAESWQRNAQNAQAVAARQAAMRDAVDRANRAVAERNKPIVAVLSHTTDLELGDQPMDWWKWWWQEYNSMYSDSPKPEYYYENYATYTGSSPGYAPVTSVGSGPIGVIPSSCFAPGTKVWTLTGLAPIEQIKVGDCVLAQNPDSGELAYKPVLATTTRPPGPRTKIAVGAETITATPGHPFWVVGQGWRLTKELNAGERFHTLSGSASIDSVEKIEDAEAEGESAYNLIVADFSSYFVGEHGILVHDNTPRKPTAALVPGLAVVKHDNVETKAE